MQLKTNRIKQFLSLLLAMLTFSLLVAQQKQLQFRYLTIDDGLSSSSVLSIIQDFKGYMWIGTYVGLNRYDGHEFRVYKNNPDDPTSLFENHVRSIFQDSRNNLLIGTNSGLSLLDRNKDRFYNYMTKKESALYGLYGSVLSITEDKHGTLWLGTNAGLVSFNIEQNTYRLFKHDPINPRTISNDEIEFVLIDSQGRLWIASRGGIDLMNTETGEVTRIRKLKTQKVLLPDIFFLSIAEDKSGNLWFGSREGLFSIEKSSDPLNDGLTQYKHNPKDPASLSINQVKSLFVDNDNNLWIGTENGGLNLFDKNTRHFQHFRIDLYNPKSLNNESIQTIFEDRTGNLWVGTFAGGLNIATKNSDAIYHYKFLPGSQQSLSHNVVTCFLKDHKGRIWIGTDGGGLNLFNPETGRFKQYKTENSSISSNAILCVYQDSENRIWLGTWAGGLVLFDPEKGSFKEFTTRNSSIQDNNIYSIVEGNKNELWLGSFEKGLINFQLDGNTFTNYTESNSDLFNNLINILRKDEHGTIYIGGIRGIQLFSINEKKFRSFQNVANDTTTISHYTVSDIHIVNDSMVWVGTLYGLNLFNPITGKFRQFYEKNGLPDNVIKGIGTDSDGDLWISTNNGLVNFDPSGKSIINYTKEDGLQSNEFCIRSCLITEDGEIYFGGTNGFNLIRKAKLINSNKLVPNIVITDFRLFHEHVSPDDPNSVLTKAIDETKQIILNYKQSTITFTFAALDYTIPGKNHYAYCLKPMEADFNYVGEKTEANYTNLTPGKYVFTAKGSNSDGIWNETGTSIEIIVKPPWWKTIVAYIIYTVFAISLLTGIYLFQVDQFNKRNKTLEQMVSQRTREIEEKNMLLRKQTNDLNEINTLLEERQQRIEEQHEVLLSKTEQLKETNLLLEERKEYITRQAKKLRAQAKELKEKNSILLTLNVTKDKFFSIIAHDLKNPFNSVMGFTEILQNKYDVYTDQKRKNLIGIINQSAQNIYRLLENLLFWARSQTEGIRISPEEFAIGQLITENFDLFVNLMNEKQLTAKIDVSMNVMVFADKNMIDTVIRNLISNAVKFSEGGEIAVWLETGESDVTVIIKDSGQGIQKQKLVTLFDLNTLKSSQGTRGEPGTGLGLVICRDFIEKNEGKIGVESEIGRGSKFYFSLPVKKANS
jgi:ligand-binding sensor domain-containing protein/signal transduction histidine kinase